MGRPRPHDLPGKTPDNSADRRARPRTIVKVRWPSPVLERTDPIATCQSGPPRIGTVDPCHPVRGPSDAARGDSATTTAGSSTGRRVARSTTTALPPRVCGPPASRPSDAIGLSLPRRAEQATRRQSPDRSIGPPVSPTPAGDTSLKAHVKPQVERNDGQHATDRDARQVPLTEAAACRDLARLADS
jgi:hypothetical protein